MGDFNSTLILNDTLAGGSNVDISMHEFKECVENIKVMDVYNSGLHFTWNQKPKGTHGVLKKLDRVMANLEFMDGFAGAFAIFKPYRISDHAPSVLKLPTLNVTKPRPFKFFNILISNERFTEVVSGVWNQQVSGFHMFCVTKKLKLLKKPFRKLLFEKGNLHDNVVRLRQKLDDTQELLDKEPYNVSLGENEAQYVNEFNEAALMEERFLKQKAKIQWLKEGDSNSAYFHKVVKSRISRSRIDVVTNAAGVLFENDRVPDAFVSHYEAFLGQPGDTNGFNTSDQFRSRLDDQVALYMVRDVTREEAWDVVANEVTDAVCEFFVNGKLLKELNHTIIALIPKIIADRIKHSLMVLVSPNQSAFVPGRSISDNILLTQELMHNYHLDRGAPRCSFKVYIQKAYDTVDWNFLRVVLHGFGFHPRMIIWIMECVTTTSYSISINGALHGYFHGKRGLRQGDPLSPYLFTLIMEILTLMLQRRVANADHFYFHGATLDEFKEASGLVPSLHKSTAYFCNVLNHVKLAILNVLLFEEGMLLVKYLGVPLVSSRLLIRDCKELVERIQLRIQDWKNKYLSIAGRLQLTRPVLGSMHIFWASVFILPSRVLNNLEQHMRGFLWGYSSSGKPKSKVAWDSVCLPKDEGAASFWDIPMRGNMTWGWRKMLQIHPLIREFIWSKVGNGSRTSLWFDTWCDLVPLSNMISNRDIHRAGLNMHSTVKDIIVNGTWVWPQFLNEKYTFLSTIHVPLLVDESVDQYEWRNSGGHAKKFSVSIVWDSIRPRDVKDDKYAQKALVMLLKDIQELMKLKVK
ncbi:hypothetical protein Tco_0596942 [Tanacetum coccineum]